jgi:hypothetical protein
VPKVVHKTGGDTISILLIDVLSVGAIKFAKSPVFAGLHAGVDFMVIHAIRFEEDDRAHENPISEKIACPEDVVIVDRHAISSIIGK